MFNFDRSDVQRIAVAAFGALILSATFITATIAPVEVVQASTLSAPIEAGR